MVIFLQVFHRTDRWWKFTNQNYLIPSIFVLTLSLHKVSNYLLVSNLDLLLHIHCISSVDF